LNGSCPTGKPSTETIGDYSQKWLDKQSEPKHSNNTPHEMWGRAFPGPPPQALFHVQGRKTLNEPTEMTDTDFKGET